MILTRITAIAMLLLGLATCALGAFIGVTPAIIPVQLADGTTATVGQAMIGAICLFIPALIMIGLSAALWWLVLPEQRRRAIKEDATVRLRGHVLQLYCRSVAQLLAQWPAGSDEHQAALAQVREMTFAVLPDLDGLHKRALIQYLYDAHMIRIPAQIDLHGADLREIDLRSADLCAVDLRGADLRGARLAGARLSRANLSGALLTYEQLRQVAAIDGAIFSAGTQ